jgi:hypothetical protein
MSFSKVSLLRKNLINFRIFTFSSSKITVTRSDVCFISSTGETERTYGLTCFLWIQPVSFISTLAVELLVKNFEVKKAINANRWYLSDKNKFSILNAFKKEKQ